MTLHSSTGPLPRFEKTWARRNLGGSVLAASDGALWACVGSGQLTVCRDHKAVIKRRWEGPIPTNMSFGPACQTLMAAPFVLDLDSNHRTPSWRQLNEVLLGQAQSPEGFSGTLEVTSAALSNDGSRLVCACWIRPPKTIRRSQTIRPKPFITQLELPCLRVLETLEIGCAARGASVYGERLIAFADDQAWLYGLSPMVRRVATGKHTARVVAMALDRGEQRLLTGDNSGRVCIWSTSDGKLLQKWETDSEPVLTLRIAADGHRIMSVSGSGRVFGMILDDPDPPAVIRISTASCEAAALSPRRRTLLLSRTNPAVTTCFALEWQ